MLQRIENEHIDFNVLKVRNTKIIDMHIREMAVTDLKVKTTRCDETCNRYDMDRFCAERRWIHETTKLYRRRMLMGKKKYPVCLARRKTAEETGCLRHQKGTGAARRVVAVH